MSINLMRVLFFLRKVVNSDELKIDFFKNFVVLFNL